MNLILQILGKVTEEDEMTFGEEFCHGLHNEIFDIGIPTVKLALLVKHLLGRVAVGGEEFLNFSTKRQPTDEPFVLKIKLYRGFDFSILCLFP